MTAAATRTGNRHGSRVAWVGRQAGFTIIELMIVLTIVAILSAVAIPNYQWAMIRAREAVLQENLYGIRSAIDQYYADQGKYPEKLEDLTSRKYLRAIPRDPFTKSSETWVTVPPPADPPPDTTGSSAPLSPGAMSLPQGNVYDVRSGSELVGSNGTPYKDW